MKARIKGTNILIDVERSINPCSQNIDDGMYIYKNGRMYRKEQLDIINTIITQEEPNWNEVRIKASIKAMEILCSKFNWSEDKIAKSAVLQADCLIKELKK